MPGFRSHFIFGQNALTSCKTAGELRCIKEHKTYYQLGQQGPDLFFYFAPAHLFHRSNIGTIMHNTATLGFIDSLVFTRNRLLTKTDRDIADAYIAGFMGHYSFDTACHPYIHYRAKKMTYKDDFTKSFGIHVALETDIDAALLRHYMHLNVSQFALEPTIALSPKERIVISHLIAGAIGRTYPDHKMFPLTVNLAICNFWLLNKLMRDPKGRKKRLVRFIDERICHHIFVSGIVANDGFKAYKDPCNLRHMKWHNPWEPSITSHQDVYQLMEQGLAAYELHLENYKNLIATLPKKLLPTHEYGEEYYRRLNYLLQELGDLSYDSGLPL